MRRRLIALLALLLSAPFALAQQATVTATISNYAGGAVTATFVPQGTGGPTVTVVNGPINLNGAFSLLVWNNTFFSYAPSVTQFQICAAAPNTSTCYTATVTITGNQDITSAFNGAPTPGGGTGPGGINQLTGDVTAGPGTGSQAATLATVNSNTGSCGDATHVAQVTLNAKGLATGCTPVAISPSGGTFTNENLAFSATPTFSLSTTSSRIALSGNITTFTLAAGTDGQPKCLEFTHDATSTAYTVTPPSNVLGFMNPIGTTASLHNQQCFTYYTSDSAWIAQTPGVINQ